LAYVRTARHGAVAASLAALLAAVAAPVRGDEGPPGRLSVVPDRPVLQPGEGRVALRVEGCDGAEPVLSASAGSVVGVRTVGPGRAVADYVPPPEARPQVAIVVAACGTRYGWTPIPIVGRGIAIARTQPGAAIRVIIGTRSYGPAIADASGEARVTVDVPPGVRFAYQGERPLDLRVPPARHAHVVVDPPAMRADRPAEVRVLAFAVTAAGAPRGAAPLRLAASAGTLDRPVEIEPGVSLARWTLPAGAAGRVRVEAHLDGDAGSPGVAELARPPGPPALIEAAPDRTLAVAGDPPVQLDVTVLDAAGNPAPGDLRVEPPDLVLERRGTGPGTWAVGLEVPEQLAGRAALDVSVAAGDAAASAHVALAAAPAERLAVEPAAREVVADGRATLGIRVALLDRFGNPALETPPAAESREGSEVATVRDGDGFLVTVRPRRRLAPADDLVTITGAGRTERLPLALQPPAPLVAVAARVGLVAASSGAASGYLGAAVELHPSSRLGASLEAGALALGREDRVPVGAAAVALRGEVRYLPLVASLRGRWAPSPRTVLLAGAGAALAAASAEVRVAGQPAVRENGLAAGAQLSLGAGRRLGAGTMTVEARGLWLSDLGLEAVRGRVLAAGLVAGWSHAVF
jgi:hypothetical protein